MSSSKLKPPPGGDVSIGYQLQAGALTTFTIAALTICIRLVARSIYAKLGLDDMVMVLAGVMALIATIFDFFAVHYGIGRHIYYVREIPQALFWDNLSQVFCIMGLVFCKISICLTLLRVIQGTYARLLRWILYITMGLVFAVNVVVCISFFVQCTPSAKAFNPKLPGKCWVYPTEIDLAILQGSFSAATDFELAILPIFVLNHLRVSRKNKITLLILLGLGFITGIFALVRTVEAGLSIRSASTDITYASVLPLLWASLERNIAIMVANVPQMRSLAKPVMNFTSNLTKYGRSSDRDALKLDSMTDRSGRTRATGSSQPSYLQTKHSDISQNEDIVLPIQPHDHV